MLFNSISFLIFFGIVCLGYYVLPHRFRWMLLLAASCYFYMAFIPAYILILFYLIAVDFIAGIYIEGATGKKRKLFLLISIIANVGTLFFFKYFNFFSGNVADIASFLHWNYPLWTLQIALPLGLSFHTFQSLAYVIEVYKKRYPAERHLGIYALYVLFFPQLVAGPIERPQQLLPQLHAHHEFNENGVTEGLGIMLWGFFKKVAIADWIGVFVDSIYRNLHGSSGPTLAFAAAAFTVQLYADFSGYSDIARGSAKVLGIDLVKNFQTPFFSRSIAEFWRRWHISLSSWFRDYLYQPVALSWARASKWGIYLALIATFMLIGLWHGAAWTYVVFGAIFGSYIVIGMLTKKRRDRIARATGLAQLPMLHAFSQILITFTLVCIGMIFFRAPSLHDALYYVAHLTEGWSAVLHRQFWLGTLLDQSATGLTPLRFIFTVVSAGLMLVGEYAASTERFAKAITASPRWLRWGGYYALIFWILIFGYYYQRTFIYFQF